MNYNNFFLARSKKDIPHDEILFHIVKSENNF